MSKSNSTTPNSGKFGVHPSRTTQKRLADDTKTWLTESIMEDTLPEINTGLTKYGAMLANLRKKEGAANAKTHHKTQAATKEKLDKDIKTKEAEVEAKRKSWTLGKKLRH
jgi:hypothetical protein